MITYFYIEECTLCDARTNLSAYLSTNNKPGQIEAQCVYAVCDQCDYTQTILYRENTVEITIEEARLLDIKERL